MKTILVFNNICNVKDYFDYPNHFDISILTQEGRTNIYRTYNCEKVLLASFSSEWSVVLKRTK